MGQVMNGVVQQVPHGKVALVRMRLSTLMAERACKLDVTCTASPVAHDRAAARRAAHSADNLTEFTAETHEESPRGPETRSSPSRVDRGSRYHRPIC